ncbi:MAG TPA: SDR family oxidoreductase [Caulobacteraceae bacterium]|jgi:NAD(P)-dependent dehydrogenase (short-subunit alcohol dehydrogenase family)|nr:SDR family oxidoreductase [Caulobacteraceae bacterium]
MALNVLITGSNSGLGLVTATTFARAGHKVHASLRNLARAGALEAARASGLPIEILALDVTDDRSARAAVVQTNADAPIDVLVNNAGFGVSGPIELVSDANLRRQFDTNVFGMARMIRLVAPSMRARGRGTIINISSISGLVAGPFTGAYSASKHAVEALSQALWFELRPFGVRVVLIEPGGFPTDFDSNIVSEAGWAENSPYGALANRLKAAEDAGGTPQQDPQVVADLIVQAATSENPKLRYLAGGDAQMLAPLYRSLDFEAFVSVMVDRLGLGDVLRPPGSELLT